MKCQGLYHFSVDWLYPDSRTYSMLGRQRGFHKYEIAYSILTRQSEYQWVELGKKFFSRANFQPKTKFTLSENVLWCICARHSTLILGWNVLKISPVCPLEGEGHEVKNIAFPVSFQNYKSFYLNIKGFLWLLPVISDWCLLLW